MFVRLSGCNLACSFCDTDHGPVSDMSFHDVAHEVRRRLHLGGDGAFPRGSNLVVITGGEPFIQSGASRLIQTLESDGLVVQVETNGTVPFPQEVETLARWGKVFISMSPKTVAQAIPFCHSLKVLYPYLETEQGRVTADLFQDWHAPWKSLQPLDDWRGTTPSAYFEDCTREVIRLGYPWRVGLQIHKILGVE